MLSKALGQGANLLRLAGMRSRRSRGASPCGRAVRICIRGRFQARLPPMLCRLYDLLGFPPSSGAARCSVSPMRVRFVSAAETGCDRAAEVQADRCLLVGPGAINISKIVAADCLRSSRGIGTLAIAVPTVNHSYIGPTRDRKQRFYAAHPTCCFRGGGTTVAAKDHWRLRRFFSRSIPQTRLLLRLLDYLRAGRAVFMY